MPHSTNRPTADDMPPVTDAHRRAAFCAMRWVGWSFDAAMADETKRRVIECRAHTLRTDEWLATQQRTVVPVVRCKPGADGHPMKWATQLVYGPLRPVTQIDFEINQQANAAPL